MMSPDRYQPDGLKLEPTPERVFLNRRTFMKAATCTLLAPAACAQDQRGASALADTALTPPLSWPEGFSFESNAAIELPEGIAPDLTPRAVAATHNNFYEFLYGRGGEVWKHTDEFVVDPWTVSITGECRKPLTLGLEELFAFPHEERTYHFRCVERWAMNVPWTGFPLRTLLERVEPKAGATHVRFVSAERPKQMPGLRNNPAGWPYHEGLRLDEAMNELAFVATGVYGRPLLKQHGAPLRIVVPWKYGYKNPKSIVSIELVTRQPPTYWFSAQPHEYGFLSNVNPNLPHPRWSQAQSYWLDTKRRFPTPIFNGYARYVAELYPDEPRTPQAALRPGQIAR